MKRLKLVEVAIFGIVAMVRFRCRLKRHAFRSMQTCSPLDLLDGEAYENGRWNRAEAFGKVIKVPITLWSLGGEMTFVVVSRIQFC